MTCVCKRRHTFNKNRCLLWLAIFSEFLLLEDSTRELLESCDLNFCVYRNLQVGSKMTLELLHALNLLGQDSGLLNGVLVCLVCLDGIVKQSAFFD